MSLKSLRLWLGVVLMPLCAVTPGQAATIIYTFDGFSESPSGVPANVSATDIDFRGGTPSGTLTTSEIGNPPPSEGRFDNSGASGTGYTFFRVTPDPGFVLNLTEFSFDERNLTNVGPTAWDVYTSADGFATPIAGAALTPEAAAFSSHATFLAAAQFQNRSDPFEVRISGFGGPPVGQTQGVWLLDNVALTFEVARARVLEPRPLAVTTLGLLLLVGWRFCQKKTAEDL